MTQYVDPRRISQGNLFHSTGMHVIFPLYVPIGAMTITPPLLVLISLDKTQDPPTHMFVAIALVTKPFIINPALVI